MVIEKKCIFWIPTFVGMTYFSTCYFYRVIPAQAGIQGEFNLLEDSG